VVGGLVYYALQREEYLSESEFIPPNLQKLPVQSGAAVMPGGAEDIAQVIAYLSSDQVRGKIERTLSPCRAIRHPGEFAANKG
jgi:hypothetical protein